MPDGEHQTPVLEKVRHLDEPAGRRLPVAGRHHQDDIAIELERINALADAGLLYEGREACAALMFDYQPQLAARPELLQRFSIALRRCNAEQLLRRLSIAMHGESA